MSGKKMGTNLDCLIIGSSYIFLKVYLPSLLWPRRQFMICPAQGKFVMHVVHTVANIQLETVSL